MRFGKLEYNMDYTPKLVEQPAPKPEYVLVDDVTGDPPPKRGPQVLTLPGGKQIKVPHAPKSNCKKCYGRGFIGINKITDEIVVCRKCYPYR